MIACSYRKSVRALCGVIRGIHRKHKKALILGIETSCDDTGMAVVNENGMVLGEAKHSQLATHVAMGGIIPPLARSLHEQHIAEVHESALRAACIHPSMLDAVAVTTRPGLGLSLQIGLNHAKNFCRKHALPLISVHHMEAHALVIRSSSPVKFPFLVLLVSGGHCQVAVVQDVFDFILLGTSCDDAPGEAFDKIARRLKINNMDQYRTLSGGAAIERLARRGDPTAIRLPPPMMRNANCDFSFSGLKYSLVQKINRQERDLGIEGDALLPNLPDICASFQHAAYIHIMKRVQRAFKFCRKTDLEFGNRLVVSGGVACSSYLRLVLEQLCEHYGVDLFVPPPRLCSDNGIMIAWNGMEQYKHGGILIQPENLDSVDFLSKCSLGQDRRDDVAKEGIRSERFKLDMDRLMRDSGNVEWQEKTGI
ncbi:putative tRNA threonylcarbamoyladenosine biosynthesis protein Osgepl1-like [Tropilaelaps mercedesae]|uniref:N(6)-L-threonylcarbamoyladenine synthase n=1 Tax=Tropilaelaps mercedesae TaxID=418985 RepID=A0A1V9Y3H3_9ACAR|nr:putative tRNA threonylcarbamoyladenosine biosynthesis protein Osgepl1-like [Tropilaelaps mercedesae]